MFIYILILKNHDMTNEEIAAKLTEYIGVKLLKSKGFYRVKLKNMIVIYDYEIGSLIFFITNVSKNAKELDVVNNSYKTLSKNEFIDGHQIIYKVENDDPSYELLKAEFPVYDLEQAKKDNKELIVKKSDTDNIDIVYKYNFSDNSISFNISSYAGEKNFVDLLGVLIDKLSEIL